MQSDYFKMKNSFLPLDPPAAEQTHHPDRQQPRIDNVKPAESVDNLLPVEFGHPFPIRIHISPIAFDSSQVLVAGKLVQLPEHGTVRIAFNMLLLGAL